jgi:hypothetical protein
MKKRSMKVKRGETWRKYAVAANATRMETAGYSRA